MSDQLQDLLKKVYDEGVAKAEAEARRILDAAKEEVSTLKAKAEEDAAAIVADAKKKADDQAKNTESDLKLAAQHTLNTLKARVTDLILASVYDQKVSDDFKDPDFTKKLMLEALKAFKDSGSDGVIKLSESLEKDLDEQFKASLKTVLDGKLTIEVSPKISQGFVIAPANGAYKISFTDEDFAKLFKSYLRPRTQKLLFEA